MKVRISLKYDTQWGEKLAIRLSNKLMDMSYVYAGTWSIELEEVDLTKGNEYSFELWGSNRCLRKEWKKHVLIVPSNSSTEILSVRDRWLDRPDDAPFYSSAFCKVIFKRPESTSKDAGKLYPGAGNLTFCVALPQVRPDEAVAITGSSSLFKDWTNVRVLNDARFPLWNVTLNVTEPFEYKFVIVDKKTHFPKNWEEGANHFFGEVPAEGVHLVISDNEPKFRFQTWKGAGTAIPLFSLRSQDSFGVGEFNDIKLLVDWAVETGQSVIQILPINDTTITGTWMDSYPYKANSSFALHPQYLHLPDAGVRVDKNYRELQAELNALPQEDYERVNNEKTRLMRKAFTVTGPTVIAGADYKKFVKENGFWLISYAAFCVLRDQYQTSDFSKWGQYSKYNSSKVDEFSSDNSQDIEFYCYEQFCLDQQLNDAVSYAHSNGVILKGDLPIGISRESVDAWLYPSMFHLDSQAGAPPDAFSVFGQNWGFPTYNWDNMAKDGFSWWKARLRKLSEYFDAFRIDHILGFFRIWEIPSDCIHALLGHFSPALPLSAAELLGIGFDMENGAYVTPKCCDWVLEEIFGSELAAEVRAKYMKDGKLIPAVSTQQKIVKKFCTEEQHTLRDGFLTLLDDVLFVEDPRKKGYYHPRIAAQSTFSFKSLDVHKQNAFNRLYDDFFYRRHNHFWKESAMSKLPELLDSTQMLACGEDLGMVPDCVNETMNELRILSLEIQRMPKDPGLEFGDISAYPYLSVCTTGSHDTSNIRAWWEEDRSTSEDYYYNVLHCEGEIPYYCDTWLCDMIVTRHLQSPSILTILPLQDWLSIKGEVRYQGNPCDERVNVPADSRHYWRYRMHLTLEKLLADKDFNNTLKDKISMSAR